MGKKQDKDIQDARSTMRRRARGVLETTDRPYFCGSKSDGTMDVQEWGCGRSPVLSVAPGGMYPAMGALQANHINKNIYDNDPSNLEWLCASCHKERDQQTEKGESVLENEFGYPELL